MPRILSASAIAATRTMPRAALDPLAFGRRAFSSARSTAPATASRSSPKNASTPLSFFIATATVRVFGSRILTRKMSRVTYPHVWHWRKWPRHSWGSGCAEQGPDGVWK